MASEQCSTYACNFLDILYTTMDGEEESLQLRIDVSLDQDNDENQEIIYSQSSDNSDMNVVNLESNYPPLSSISDGTMSGPENVELVSPNIPPIVSDLLARGSPIYHLLRDATISSIISAHQSQSLSLLHNPQMGQTKLQEKD